VLGAHNHFALVVRGERTGSPEIEAKIAAVVGRPVEDVFAPRTRPLEAGSADRRTR